jgi:hypothetical protein
MNKFIVMVASGVLLAGCTASKPPERHAIAFTENHSSTDGVSFSPQGTYRNIIPTFEKCTIKENWTASLVMMCITRSNMPGCSRSRPAVISPKHTTESGDKMPADPKDADSIGNELSATYLDGYNGVY